MIRACAICGAALSEDNPTWVCAEDKLLLRNGYYGDRELWAPVPGYEGSYEVSNLGGVRSLSRITVNGGGAVRVVNGQPLSPFPDRDGYLQVNLSRRTHKVHRLVLQAFVGPCPPGMECLHDNDVKTDNHLENLSWGTSSANKFDAVRNGRHWACRRGGAA
jgi:hypothetical protein